MDFRRTHCRRGNAAFTFVELMVSMAIAVLCGAALAGFLFQFSRNSTAIVRFATVNSADRHSIQRVARDFREADSFHFLSASNISLDVDGETVDIFHSARDKTLVRKDSARAEVLLQNCESLSFLFMERHPDSTAFERFQVSTSATCRIMQMSWISVVQEKGNDSWMVTNTARFLNRRGLSH